MKPEMIEPRILTALEMIHAVLDGAPVLWTITGSLGMALQGLPVSVRDIDLQTDAPGADAIVTALGEFVRQPLMLRETERMRSIYALLEIEGVEVEIIGDIQRREAGADWEPPVDLKRVRRWAHYDEMMLPVLSIAYEAGAYRRMERAQKADMLQKWADEHPEDRVEAVTNYRKISPTLGTGGMPLESQIGALARDGYAVLVNLAMPGTPYALENEAELAAEHELEYHAIPVVWEAPTLQNLADFFSVMQASQGRKTFAHCVLNMRVSCFVFLYRVVLEGRQDGVQHHALIEAARADMLHIWQPNLVWQRFLREAGEAYGVEI